MAEIMKPQDRAIETLKIKGALYPILKTYGFERVRDVMEKSKWKMI